MCRVFIQMFVMALLLVCLRGPVVYKRLTNTSPGVCSVAFQIRYLKVCLHNTLLLQSASKIMTVVYPLWTKLLFFCRFSEHNLR